MRIYIDDNSQLAKEFQLPVDFYPEMSRTNPFLTDEGSQSVPMTLPASEHNMNLIGYPYRINKNARPATKLSAIMEDGTTWLRGTLYIEKANRLSGIECTFYTNEGQLYEKIKNQKLGDLKWEEMAFSGDTIDVKVSWALGVMKLAMTSDMFPFYVFPVLTDTDLERSDFTREGMKVILNEVITSIKGDVNSVDFVGVNVRDMILNNGSEKTKISLPKGYGITPFLKISYIIRFIFSKFGYVLDRNMFDTDRSLSRLVLINNTADSICSGTLRYKDLIPENMGIMDFIDIIRIKFGVEFIEKGKHIIVKDWNTAILTNTDMDLSQYVDLDPTIEFVSSKSLSIKMDKSIKQTETDTETYQQFIAKYPKIVKVTSTLEPPGYTYLQLQRGMYFRVEVKFTTYDIEFNYIFISSEFFDVIPNGEKEEISCADLSVPEVMAASTIKEGAQYAEIYLPVIKGIRHKQTEITLSNTEKVKEEKEEEMSVCMAFSVPGMQEYSYISTLPPVDEHQFSPMGSSFAYDSKGRRWGELSLIYEGEWNLYTAYYLNRDNMLQRANQIVTFNALIPTHLISTMDVTVPKTLNGQKIMIERIDYIVGRPELCKVTARTLHLFKLDKEPVPDPTPIP